MISAYVMDNCAEECENRAGIQCRACLRGELNGSVRFLANVSHTSPIPHSYFVEANATFFSQTSGVMSPLRSSTSLEYNYSTSGSDLDPFQLDDRPDILNLVIGYLTLYGKCIKCNLANQCHYSDNMLSEHA